MSTCIIKDISGSWLTNGSLETCLLKLQPPSEQEWTDDTTRPQNIIMLRNLLCSEIGSTEPSLLQKHFSNHPVLILAPELAFGSEDYAALLTIISAHPHKLIFIGGFGFTSGSALNRLVVEAKIIPVWQNNLNEDAKFNCGWVWVNDGSGGTTCYVFLKNFPEQTNEIAIPHLAQGENILRLQTDDAVIFPLICADIISDLTNSPRKAIVQSLTENNSGQRKILVTGSLYDTQSSSDWWKTPIANIVNDTEARLILCNCNDPPPIPNEDHDKWRCLTGAYQSRSAATSLPSVPLPFARFVMDTRFCGFVLRNTQSGCAFGKVGWTNDPSKGKYVWTSNFRYLSHLDKLNKHDGFCAADELHRFITRFKCVPYESEYSVSVKAMSKKIIDSLLNELSPFSNSILRERAEELLNKCLSGLQYKADKKRLENLHDDKDSLDCALIILLFIKHSIEASILPTGKSLDYGQLLSTDAEKEFLIWVTNKSTGQKMYGHLESLAQESGSARPLIVVGKGNGLVAEPSSGRVQSNRTTNITEASPNEENRDFLVPRDRVIFWKQLGEIGAALTPQNDVDAVKQTIKQGLEA